MKATISPARIHIAGAHPEVLRRLTETNAEPLPGYGSDRYCESAKEKIRNAAGIPDAEIAFLSGGTQANAVVISSMLADYEGVIAAKTGHISTHEAGAIEYTGHEVLELPQEEGKIAPETLEKYLSGYFADENREHMTYPGCIPGRNWKASRGSAAGTGFRCTWTEPGWPTA